MDLSAVIKELYAEKHRLDRLIATLESLQVPAAPAQDFGADGRQRRQSGGRLAMDDKEREDASDRMKAWRDLKQDGRIACVADAPANGAHD